MKATKDLETFQWEIYEGFIWIRSKDPLVWLLNGPRANLLFQLLSRLAERFPFTSPRDEKQKKKSLASSSFSIVVTDDEKKMRFTTEQVHSLILFVSIVSLSLLLSLAFSALVNLLWFSSTMISVRIWNPTSKYDSWTFLCLLFSFSFLSCSVARSVILYKIRFKI